MRAAVLFLTLVLGPAGAMPPLPLRINCGGDSLTLAETRAYRPDHPYDPARGYGHVGGVSHAPYRYLQIGGTRCPELYLSERVGSPCTYRIDLPSGEYILTLRLAPMRTHIGGVACFDISQDGTPLVRDLDLAARGPRCYAQDMRWRIATQGASFDIAFCGAPEVAALEIALADSTATASCALGLEALARCGGIYLKWDPDASPRTGAFRIERRAVGEAVYTSLPRERHLAPFYWDRTARSEETYRYRVTALDVWDRVEAVQETAPIAPLPRDGSVLPTVTLEILPADLFCMYADPHEEHWVPAQVEDRNGRVRLRGGISREFQKKSFKFRCGDDQRIFGRSVFNLIWKADATFIRESLAAHLFRRAGVPAAACAFHHLLLNDETQGVYLSIEQIDDEFLSSRGLTSAGSLYKVEGGDMRLPAGPEDYGRLYEKKTGDEGDLTDMIAFVELVNLTPDETFTGEIWEALDVGEYLDWYAVIALTANRDIMNRNHYYYRPPEGRWKIIPWDNDLAFPKYLADILPLDMGVVGSEPPVSGGTNLLITRLMTVPAFRHFYAEKLAQFLVDLYAPAQLIATADSLFAQVAPDGERDCRKYTWEDNAAFHEEMEAVRTFITRRASHVAKQLDEFRLAHGDVRITELALAPDGALRWCELRNVGSATLATDALALSNDPLGSTCTTLPPGTLDAGHFLVVAFGAAPPGIIAHATLPENAGSTRCLALWQAGVLRDLTAWPSYLQGNTLLRRGTLDTWHATATPTPGWEDAPVLGTGSLLLVTPEDRTVTIACILGAAGDACLRLYDVSGRTVRTLREGWWPTGATTISWNGRDAHGAMAPAGVYFLKLDAREPAAGRLLWVP